LKTFSFFEVEENHADEVIDVLNKSRFNDRRVAVEIAQAKPEIRKHDRDSGKRKDEWEDRRHKRKHEKGNDRFKGKKSSAVKYPGRKRIKK
jgi:hypothetical protein